MVKSISDVIQAGVLYKPNRPIRKRKRQGLYKKGTPEWNVRHAKLLLKSKQKKNA